MIIITIYIIVNIIKKVSKEREDVGGGSVLARLMLLVTFAFPFKLAQDLLWRETLK